MVRFDRLVKKNQLFSAIKKETEFARKQHNQKNLLFKNETIDSNLDLNHKILTERKKTNTKSLIAKQNSI